MLQAANDARMRLLGYARVTTAELQLHDPREFALDGLTRRLDIIGAPL